MSILINPEQEIINSLLSEIQNEIDSQQIFEPEKKIQKNSVEYWIQQGHKLLDSEEYEQALESFEQAISINPDEAEYWYWKSRCLKDLFKEKEALKAIEKAISIERNEEYLQLRDSLYTQ